MASDALHFEAPMRDDSVEDALRRCAEHCLAELCDSRASLGGRFDVEWRAHAQSAARLLVSLMHLSGGSLAALRFAETVAADGGVDILVEAGIAQPLARAAATVTCLSTHDAEAAQILSKLLLHIFEARCGTDFARALEPAEAVACLLLIIEGPRAPRALPEALLDKVEGKCLEPIMTTALSRAWAMWSPEACDCVCDIAIRAFAASSQSVETFLGMGGVEILLSTRSSAKVLRLFAALSKNVAKSPRELRLHDVVSRLRCTLADAIVCGSYDDCHDALEATETLLSNRQLSAIVFKDDFLALRLAEEFLRRVELDEPHAARLACRGFARGMTRALAGNSLPPKPLLASVVQAYCRTEATVGDRDARMAACNVLCHWCVGVDGVEPQLMVLRDAFKLLASEGGPVEAHGDTLDASATLLLDCVSLPSSLSLPREHAVFLIARSIAGRKCPPWVGVLGRRFRRMLAEVAEQFSDAYGDNRPMLQHALDTINFYDVLCESTRASCASCRRALPKAACCRTSSAPSRCRRSSSRCSCRTRTRTSSRRSSRTFCAAAATW